MNVKRSSEGAEPVTLDAVKNYIKASYGSDVTEDELITTMSKAARIACERYVNRSLVTCTLTCFWHSDEVIENRVAVPYGPHGDISELVNIHDDGTETAMTVNEDYYVHGHEFKEIHLTSNAIYNVDQRIRTLDYKLTIAAGYGQTGLESLPEIYKLAIMTQVAEWYVNREDFIQGGLHSKVRSMLNSVAQRTWL